MSLGISIYPSDNSFERDSIYIKKAASLGYKRVFTCLLSQKLEKNELKNLIVKYSELIHKNNMVLSVDTNPKIFEKLETSPKNLEIFKDMGVDIIRLDGDFGVKENVEIINNNQGIIIELNSSNELPLNELEKFEYDKSKLYTCHNFYPQRFTGLDDCTVKEFTENIIKNGIKSAAFISSNEKNTFGPWPVSDGLPTIEDCRDMSVDEQIRYMESFDLFDDIFFGNAYASDEELEIAAKYHKKEKVIKLKFEENVKDEDKKIVLDNIHQYRHDGNNIILRSSRTRNKEVFLNNIKENLSKKDLILINDNMKYYMGELEIVLQNIKNDGARNYLGTFDDVEFKITKNIRRGDIFRVEEK